MLSKIIYKTLMVFALAFIAQVGYSQNYVSSDVATSILKQELAQLSSSIKSESNVPTRSTLQPSTKAESVANLGSSEIKFQLMKSVTLRIVEKNESVAQAMDYYYAEANNNTNSGEAARDIAVLNDIQELLLF